MKKILTILIIIFVLFSCQDKKKTKNIPNSQNKEKTDKTGYKIITVGKGNITEVLEENGEISPTTKVDIKSRISGKITRLLTDEGQIVRKNQVVAIIEPDLVQVREITSLVNTLKTAEINYNDADTTLKQKKEYLMQGYLSESDIKDLENKYQIAKMNLDKAREEYEKFKSETGEKGTIAVKELYILSPISGIILKRNVDPGDSVSETSSSKDGTILYTVADVSKLIVNVNINEIDVYKLDIESKVDVLIPANPSADYNGYVSRISPYAAVNKGIKVFACEITLYQNDRKLRTGMSAVIRAELNAKNNIITVPISSVFVENNKDYVIVPAGNGKLAKKYIVRGINDDKNVEIVEGLSEGDEIYNNIPVKELKESGGFIPAYENRVSFDKSNKDSGQKKEQKDINEKKPDSEKNKKLQKKDDGFNNLKTDQSSDVKIKDLNSKDASDDKKSDRPKSPREKDKQENVQ